MYRLPRRKKSLRNCCNFTNPSRIALNSELETSHRKPAATLPRTQTKRVTDFAANNPSSPITHDEHKPPAWPCTTAGSEPWNQRARGMRMILRPQKKMQSNNKAQERGREPNMRMLLYYLRLLGASSDGMAQKIEMRCDEMRGVK